MIYRRMTNIINIPLKHYNMCKRHNLYIFLAQTSRNYTKDNDKKRLTLYF